MSVAGRKHTQQFDYQLNRHCSKTSRKFWLSLAAFLAALGGGLSGVVSPEACAVLMAASAAVYAACEAYVDGKAAGANTTATTRSVTATSADKATVVAAFGGERGE